MTMGRTVPARYAACRTWQHAWDFTTVKKEGIEYIQGLRCIRCGTERAVRISSKDGDRVGGNKYMYPEDLNPEAEPYKMPKDSGGMLTADERSAIRLMEVKAHYGAVRDQVAQQRARKKA